MGGGGGSEAVGVSVWVCLGNEGLRMRPEEEARLVYEPLLRKQGSPWLLQALEYHRMLNQMRYFFISVRLTWGPGGRRTENAPGSWGLAAISFNLTLSACLLMIVTAILARAMHTLSRWHFLASSCPFQINRFIDRSHLLHLASRHRAGRGRVQRGF